MASNDGGPLKNVAAHAEFETHERKSRRMLVAMACSDAAYKRTKQSAQVCVDQFLKKHGVQNLNIIEFRDTKYIAAENDVYFVLAFKGTDPKNSDDVWNDMTCWNRHGFKTKGGQYVEMHHGFYDQFRACYDFLCDMRQDIPVHTRIADSKKEVIITGHSLGGAVATIYCLDLLVKSSEHNESPVWSCVTFGCPFTAGGDAAQYLTQRGCSRFFENYTTKNDPVPAASEIPLWVLSVFSVVRIVRAMRFWSTLKPIGVWMVMENRGNVITDLDALYKDRAGTLKMIYNVISFKSHSMSYYKSLV